MKTILFVCTGNTCRSSMAEALFRRMLEEAGEALQGIRVISAGTFASKGEGASKQAIQVMQEREINLKDHSSTPLTRELVDDAELILTMTRNHKDQVLRMNPEAIYKTFTLKEYAGRLGDDKEKLPSIDILDPFGQRAWIYRECAKEIEESLKIVLRNIIEDSRK